jgi:glycosyltransferase involved in cell wall biosynthesis
VTAEGGGFEGFGIVYLEAAAAGIPSIGSLDCGAEDAIQDKISGRLVSQ